MALTLTHATLARVDELFRYKASDLELPAFPGYTRDQWGIKAHNRPWIVEAGQFTSGQRIAEVGGAYSRLPEYLGERFAVEPWVIDDFGLHSGEPLWSRWGNPHDLPGMHPTVRYSFHRMGNYSPEIPARYFDRIFSVSTLEHIQRPYRLDVLKDMHRCLAPRGIELHTIDVSVPQVRRLFAQWASRLAPVVQRLDRRFQNDIDEWLGLFSRSGVLITSKAPSLLRLLDRATLVESPDVVYRFYPPVDSPKPYRPGASLLLVIEDL